MRCVFGVVLLGALGALAPQLGASSAQPAKEPLLKAVTPPAGQVRVRVPLAEGMTKAIQMRAQVPHPKKKGETIEITVALDTINRSMVTAKMLENWGYPAPTGKTFVLPELLIVGNQLAPKSAKGSDVLVRITNLKMDVIEAAPDGGSQLFNADMVMLLPDLLKVASRPAEPRFHFNERFLDLTIPPTLVRRPGTGEEPMPEPEAPPDPKLATVACPLSLTPGLSFTSASVNGTDTFHMPDGKTHTVVPMLASCTHGGNGVIMNIGMARALKLDVDLTKDATAGMSTDKKLRLIEYKLKELRVGVLSGPGLKVAQELVFTDIPIWIEVIDSDPGLWIGYPFIATHFKDAVLAITPDGTAKLHGRVNPELIKDPRPKKKP
ncbi:MAG TPA: hypothetical protein VKE74_09750 [Gemmataceae bacterium]|nr:hypothetical protein [Gemmataceae bacterium]